MVFYESLLMRCNVKLVDFDTVMYTDDATGMYATRVICYIETDNAWCDSGDEVCLSRPMAREVAAKRFMALLKQHGFDDANIDNLASRSTSPASPAARLEADRPVRGDITERAGRAQTRSAEPEPRGERERRNSIAGAIGRLLRGSSYKAKKERAKTPR